MTCRICGEEAHLAKDCPTKKQDVPEDIAMGTRNSNGESHQPSSSNNVTVQHESLNSPSSESIPTPATPAEQGVSDSDSEALFSDPDTPKTVQRQIFGTETEVSADDTDKETTVWADLTEKDPETEPDAKAQAESNIGFKPYCPRCRVNTHTDDQFSAHVIRQANKRKSSDSGDSKPGKSGKKDFKRFKSDLAQVVVRGKDTDSLQYIMETNDNARRFACYLLFRFGGLTEALRAEGHHMMGNEEVMALWAKFTSKGLAKETAEELLMMAYRNV